MKGCLMADLDKFYRDMKGAEWQPLTLLKPSVVRELYNTILTLREELSDIDEATLKKDQALLDLHLAKAHMSKSKNQVEFVVHVANALMDMSAILEYLYKRRNTLK
jgi:hypothetical protein